MEESASGFESEIFDTALVLRIGSSRFWTPVSRDGGRFLLRREEFDVLQMGVEVDHL
jgi:hypothetical protein